MTLANSLRGEVSLEIRGSIRTIRFDFDALARLQDAIGADDLNGLIDAGRLLGDFRNGYLKVFLIAGLYASYDGDVSRIEREITSIPAITALNAVVRAFALGVIGEESPPLEGLPETKASAPPAAESVIGQPSPSELDSPTHYSGA